MSSSRRIAWRLASASSRACSRAARPSRRWRARWRSRGSGRRRSAGDARRRRGSTSAGPPRRRDAEEVERGEVGQLEPSLKMSVVSMPPSVRKRLAAELRQGVAVLGHVLPPEKDSSALRAEAGADHALERGDLGLRHFVATGQVVGREQEHLLDPGLLARLQEALGAALGRAEEAERVGDARPGPRGSPRDRRARGDRSRPRRASAGSTRSDRRGRAGRARTSSVSTARRPRHRRGRASPRRRPGSRPASGRRGRAPASRRPARRAIAAGSSPTMRKAPSAISPASSIMRGPAASR